MARLSVAPCRLPDTSGPLNPIRDVAPWAVFNGCTTQDCKRRDQCPLACRPLGATPARRFRHCWRLQFNPWLHIPERHSRIPGTAQDSSWNSNLLTTCQCSLEFVVGSAITQNSCTHDQQSHLFIRRRALSCRRPCSMLGQSVFEGRWLFRIQWSRNSSQSGTGTAPNEVA